MKLRADPIARVRLVVEADLRVGRRVEAVGAALVRPRPVGRLLPAIEGIRPRAVERERVRVPRLRAVRVEIIVRPIDRLPIGSRETRPGVRRDAAIDLTRGYSGDAHQIARVIRGGAGLRRGIRSRVGQVLS